MWLCPAFWSQDMTMYFVLSAFTSRPISLLAITKASVFFFIVHTLLPSILASLAWSPIIWTRKLTYIFLISVQLEAHSSSWRLTCELRITIYPSDFYYWILSFFFFFLHKGCLLSTSHINFATSSTVDIAVRRTLLQLASNCSVASARGHTATWASYRYQQHFCCLENGSGRNRQQLFCRRNRKVASARALVFSIRATKKLSNKSCQCAPSLIVKQAEVLFKICTIGWEKEK